MKHIVIAPEVKHKNMLFLIRWTLGSFVIISFSYLVSLVVVLLVHGSFGFDMSQGGTYLSQTVMQMAGGAVIGLGTGLYQRSILKDTFKVPSSWVYASVIGFVLTELIVCILLWQLNINRYELRFIELNPLPEALIFAVIGGVVGLLQWRILKPHFYNSAYWIATSALGWGICIVVTLVSVWAFFIGTLIYGILTATTLLWILQSRR
jgi:hypothetical protein